MDNSNKSGLPEPSILQDSGSEYLSSELEELDR